MIARRTCAPLVLAAGLLGTAACSALLDWNDFTGGVGDGGADGSHADGSVEGSTGDAGTDASADTTPMACGTSMQCTASAPTGWTGPVELYVGPFAQGGAPSCGTGFEATAVFDGNGGMLAAPPPTCSACGCGGATGVTCTLPVMTFYLDTSCASPAFGMQTLSTSCSATTSYIGASAVTVSAPSATGGTCTTTGGTATITAPTWATVARACAPSSAPASGGCPSGELCAPGPASPFSTAECVMQPGTATACPAGYPSGPQVFFSGVDDQRGCSACDCGSPTGGTCTIASPAIDTLCPASGSTLSAPSPCTAFMPPDTVKLVSVPTITDAGSCTLSGGGAPMGTAAGSGPTSFCCTP